MTNLKSINVLGTKYNILYVDQIEGNDAYQGMCYLDSKKILIRKDLSAADMVETIIHECIHSFLRESSIDPVINGQIEEVLVTGLAKFFVSFLKQFNKIKRPSVKRA